MYVNLFFDEGMIVKGVNALPISEKKNERIKENMRVPALRDFD
jgi:hypothetical protein